MREEFWYSSAMITIIFVSSLSYLVVDSEIIEPELYDGSAYELGRYSFTSDAYEHIGSRSNMSVIALGSSKIREAFNGLDLEDRSQIKELEFFNLAFAGERPYYRMLEVDNIIDAAPELVILEVGPTTFSALKTPVDNNSMNKMNAILRQQNWQNNPSWLDIMDEEDKDILAISLMDKIKLESSFSFSAFESAIKDKIDTKNDNNCDIKLTHVRCVPNQDSALYLEYLKYPPQFGDYLDGLKKNGGSGLADFYGDDLDKYMLASYHNPEGTYNKNHRAFDFIITELLESEIEVLLVGAPYNPVLRNKLSIGQWDYYNSSIKNYSVREDLSVLDLMWDDFDSDVYFNDYTHLSERGEFLFTDLLVPVVDKIVSDKTNNLEYDINYNYTRDPNQYEENKKCYGNGAVYLIDNNALINSSNYSECGFGHNEEEVYAWNEYSIDSDSSGVYELLIKDNFDQGLLNWTNQSSGSISLGGIEGELDFSKSIKATSDGTNTWLGTQSDYINFKESGLYKITGEINIPSDWDGGNIYFMDGSTLSDNIEEYNYAYRNKFDYESNTIIDMTNEWQKIDTFTNIGSDTHGRYYLRTTSSPSEGKYVYMDNFSIELVKNNINYMKSEPDSDAAIISPAYLAYDIEIIKETNYTIWLELRGPSDKSDSVHLLVDGIGMTYSGRGLSAGNEWKWVNNGTDIPPLEIHFEAGIHEIRILMREDGVEFARLFISSKESSFLPPER